MKFKRGKKPEYSPRYLKQQNNAPARRSAEQELSIAQKNIRRQAGLVGLTVLLTIIILFAMTSAWYTNIVQTSGLMFEAESWGFDGEITVNRAPIKASPGEKGVIHMEVENDSASVSAISVNVSKNELSNAMKQRLFFYVDTHMNRDGETMNRVYLNNVEGYTYTVFSNGKLMLTEQVSNAPQIKWQWVYDVLGYYVLAKPEVNENGDIIRMTVKEYLRPIEYDYDKATTTLITDGDSPKIQIQTVDGINSPYMYLWQLSKNDGYKGEIAYDDRMGNDQIGQEYYKVDVDETGYGVYAYLCSYTEIEVATKYDTKLGELAHRLEKNDPNLTEADKTDLFNNITLIISAQKNETTAVNVSTLDALEDMISRGNADVIQLNSDISIPVGETLNIPANTRVMVDLNGFTITSAALADASGTAVAIKAEPGSSLTMINGKLNNAGPGTKTYGVYATGAEVVLSNIEMNNFRYGVYMGDNENQNSLDSRVHIVKCELNAEWYGVFISGNGLLSEQKSQLIIEDSEVFAAGMAITGNGDTAGNGRWGTDIQIMNSVIVQTDDVKPGAAIYQPQKESTLSIYRSTVSGYTAIAIKGGSVDIDASTITGTGKSSAPASFGTSGFADTADAVYVETNYGYEIRLDIRGESKLTSTAEGSKSLRVFESTATNVRVQIESGIFDQLQPAEYLAKNAVQEGSAGKAGVTIKAGAAQ